MRVSIIVPTHNRANLVGEAIESLLQLRSVGIDPEIIVVNDGSSDSTEEVLNQFGNLVHAISTSHGERSKARNTGLTHATSDIVGFLDDDDLCIPSGWRRICDTLSADPELGFVFGRSNFTDSSGNPLPYGSQPEKLGTQNTFFSLLSLGCHITMGSVVVKRRVVQNLGGFDETINYCEDWDFWLRLAYTVPAAYVDAVCAQVRAPGWDEPGAHHWPEKLTVRARYALHDPYRATLLAGVSAQQMERFYEQLACDAFSQRCYDISLDAFKQVRELCPVVLKQPRRLSQYYLAMAACKLTAGRGR